MFYLRLNLNVAIVAMVNRTALAELNSPSQLNLTSIGDPNERDYKTLDVSLKTPNSILNSDEKLPNKTSSHEVKYQVRNHVATINC